MMIDEATVKTNPARDLSVHAVLRWGRHENFFQVGALIKNTSRRPKTK
jgi:hypothetical protein